MTTLNRPADRPSGEVTALLEALRDDETTDLGALYQRVYGELRRLASRHRARWNGNETLNTTAIIHEAYIKLVGHHDSFENRSHFLAVASRAMRQVLLSYAEAQNAQKRGGGLPDATLNEELLLTDEQAENLTTLHNALKRLEAVDERAARVVECRFFGGMTVEETAEALSVSPATITRSWRTARAWLFGELQRDPFSTSAPDTPS